MGICHAGYYILCNKSRAIIRLFSFVPVTPYKTESG